MTMYVRTLVAITVSVSDDDRDEDESFFLDSRTPFKILPVWVAERESFRRLWAAGKVQVATDSAFSNIITSIPSSGSGVTTTDIQTLTNKTITLGSNIVSGTLAEFNTAVTNADLVSLAGAEALTNKTSITSTGAVTGSTLVSTVAAGTAPLTVTSNTQVTNLNAQYLNGSPGTAASTANTYAGRDSNANLTARGFISGFTTTATAAGTTTLTIASNPIQEFTGTLAQTVVLPTTGVVAGQQYTIINNSTGAITVQSSGLNSIVVLGSNATTTVTALVATPTTAAHWDAQNGNASSLAGLGAATAALINTIAARDGNGIIRATSFTPNFTTTATAAGTTTLLVSSSSVQEFTGTLAQTVVLPTSTVIPGQTFRIINNSTGAVTVQSSALAAVGAALTTGTSAEFIALVVTPTTAAHWHRR